MECYIVHNEVKDQAEEKKSACAAKVPATSKFCPECGEKLTPLATGTVKCPKCGKFIPSTSKFCPECGAKKE